MSIRKLSLCAAASLLSLGASGATAATVALYDFRDFTAAGDPSPTYPANNGPWTNYASGSQASANSMTQTGLSLLEALRTRDTTAVTLSSHALLLGAGSTRAPVAGTNVPPAPLSTDDYFAVNVTANQNGVQVTSFNFDLGTSVGANTNATSGELEFHNLTTHAQLFYSLDNTTFISIGPLHESIADNSASGANNQGTFTGMQSYSVDLSSLPTLSSGETLYLRLGVSDNRGGGSTTMASYWDNFSVEAIPEPSVLALVGLGGLGLLARRRRA